MLRTYFVYLTLFYWKVPAGLRGISCSGDVFEKDMVIYELAK